MNFKTRSWINSVSVLRLKGYRITCALIFWLVHHGENDVTLTNQLQTTDRYCKLYFDLSLLPTFERHNRCENLKTYAKSSTDVQFHTFLCLFFKIYKLGFKWNLLFCWPLFRETFPDSAWIQWLTRRYSTYVLRMISEIYRQHWNMFVPNIIWRLGRRSAIHN